MKKISLLFLWIILSPYLTYAQGESCCQKVMTRGKILFDICEYEEALKKFVGARDGCTTCPEAQEWVTKTQNCIANPNTAGCPCKQEISQDFVPMVYVQGGTFTMGCTPEQGSDCYDSEKPAHTVTVGNYSIGKYEVTQAQWREIMGSSAPLSYPSYFQDCDNCPVEQVSYDDIQEFLQKLNQKYPGKNYRLPTEAEWEYAARGGNKKDGTKYSGSNNIENVAWYGSNSDSKTHLVGQKSPNGLGIYDMSGNVWELCSDWHGAYSALSQMNPQGTSTGSNRVFRGGSWTYDARSSRITLRRYYPPSRRSNNLGFRLSRTE